MRKIIGLLLCTVFLLVLLLSVAAFHLILTVAFPSSLSSNGAEYWAVIVGIGRYKNAPLFSYGDKDAKDLYEQLLWYPNWQPDHIKLLINSNATLEEINNTMINWLAPRENENDIILLYFSTHGNNHSSIYFSNSTEYDYYFLSTYDSENVGDYRGPMSTIIAGTWGPTELGPRYKLESWLDKLDSKNIVVILESCKSGGFINSLSKSGRVIFTASNASELDWQYSNIQNSLFTYCILATLENFTFADVNKDRLLSMEEIYEYTVARIKLEIKANPDRHEQNPQMQGAGDIVLLYRGGITIGQVIFVALISTIVAISIIFVLKRGKPAAEPPQT